MTDTINYELKYPIDVKTSSGNVQKINNLSIGRLKAKHLKLIPKGLLDGGLQQDGEKKVNFQPSEIVPLIAALTGITEDEAGELDWEDLFAITERMSDILGGVGSQKIGEK